MKTMYQAIDTKVEMSRMVQICKHVMAKGLFGSEFRYNAICKHVVAKVTFGSEFR